MKNSRVSLGFLVGNLIAVGFTLNVLPAAAIASRISNSDRSQTSNAFPTQQIAQRCGGRYYRTVSSRQIEEILDCLQIDYERQRNGVYIIDLGRYRGGYYLTLENCSTRRCRIKLSATLAMERTSRRRLQNRIAEWNSSNRGEYNTRASLDRSGYPILQSYLSLRGGTQSDNIGDFIEDFESALEDFAKYMAFGRY